MSRILHNKARCKLCDDVIESTYRWDFVTCSCGALSVDGGHDYLRRCGNLDAIEELSESTDEPEPPRKKLGTGLYGLPLDYWDEPKILGGKLSG